MVLNYECVRSLMLWLEENQPIDNHGKPKAILFRKIYDELPMYTRDDLHLAVTYLAQKNLINLRSGQTIESCTPKAFVIIGITATGYDYIAAVKDNRLWEKIKKQVGSVALSSVPTVIEVASKLLC